MDKFLEFVVDNIGGIFMLLVLGLFIWGMVSMFQLSKEQREDSRKHTQFCYSQGMVPVYSDAGASCADPRTLVKVK